MNNALTDYNLSDKEFRLLYLIVNNMSLNNTNEIELYNGFIMDKLNISERQTQRLTASLVEKGYITKVVTATKTKRNGNLIRLNGVSTGDMNSDKNVTPYNTRKINKNNNTSTSGTGTRGDKNVQSEDSTTVSGTNANDSISAETITASAHNVSFSSIEKEDHAAGSSSTEDTTHDLTVPSVSCSAGDPNQTDRCNISQLEDEDPPQIAPLPPLEKWLTVIKGDIRQAILEWSYTLTDDDVQTDDANKIVSDVLRNHTEWENYKGQFSILDLTQDAKYMMENRVRNKDVQVRIKENRYQERHQAFRKELMSA